MTIALRPMTGADLPFLAQVYTSTREEELAFVDWTPDQQAAFLDQQFRAQHQYYQEHYTGASFDIILSQGVPIGRLYVARWSDQIRIMDIALLPAYRNQGIGSLLLADLMEEASRSNKPLTIHVEKYNPALTLYHRLGFIDTYDRGVYWFLEWRPNREPERTGHQETGVAVV